MLDAMITKTAEKQAPDEHLGNRINLIGLPLDVLQGYLASHAIEPFRAKQLWNWLYVRGATDFDAMHNISKKTRSLLEQHFCIERADIREDALSEDGTRKWLFGYSGGHEIETVFIPEADRGTLCISSQVGCTLACTFCHTGTQRLVRNLNAAEIVGQVLSARDTLGEWGTPSEERIISNIVFMGMGEPLFNYDHVAQACHMLTDQNALGLSKRKVTISTSGVVPNIYKMTDEIGVNLAISLHAVRDELRNEIVPINRKYPLAALLESMRYFAAKFPSRRILIEYVMLKGVNDSDADAHQLVELLRNIPVKVNLIPFNPWPNSPYECSSNNRIHAFARILQSNNLSTPIRKTRGQDILAACGQLKSASELKKGERVKLN